MSATRSDDSAALAQRDAGLRILAAIQGGNRFRREDVVTLHDERDRLRADAQQMRQALTRIELLALEANEEYETSCRAKVRTIRSLAQTSLRGGIGAR